MPSVGNTESVQTINLPITMADNKYFIAPTTFQARPNSYYGWEIRNSNKTTASFQLAGFNINARAGTSWMVCGMAA